MVTAFVDANALFPATVRSVLLELAAQQAFRLLWSEAVHQEWMRNLAGRKPHIPLARIEQMRRLMEALSLPDPGDRHVLAAASHGGADMIVTSNQRDFPVAAPHPGGSRRSTRITSSWGGSTPGRKPSSRHSPPTAPIWSIRRSMPMRI